MRPTPDQLAQLRKGLRKRAVPLVTDNMRADRPHIGGYVFHADGDDFRVEWVIVVGEKVQPRKKARFSELCKSPAKEFERLEVGWLIADLFLLHGQLVANSIGGPIEAMREAGPIWKEADNWRHWALVPAGHMIKVPGRSS